MPTIEEVPLLTSRRAAGQLLGISVRSIDSLIAAGRLTGIPLGSRVMVERSEIVRIAAEGITGRIRPE